MDRSEATDPAHGGTTAGPDAAGPDTSGNDASGNIGPVAIIANRKSGTNARDSDAISRARKVLEESGADVSLVYWDNEGDLAEVLKTPEAQAARTILAAGGDGTAMAVAGALVSADLPRRPALAVLPLGTFNYFARGLGLSEVPEEAAAQLTRGRAETIALCSVNGRVFLNNASLGIYPDILKERERIYARWGRRRLMAHWSVVKTFLRFQRPLKLRVEADGQVQEVRTPLLFVARSAYQLEIFGLSGGDAIHHDKMAVLLGRGGSRATLFKLAWRLVTRSMKEGRDYDLIQASRLRVETASRRSLLAYDGEKRREDSPFDFRMQDNALPLLLPRGEGA